MSLAVSRSLSSINFKTLFPRLFNPVLFSMFIHRNMSNCATTMLKNNSYEEAVRTLNSLQSNFSKLDKIRKQRDKNVHQNIPNVIELLQKINISQLDIDSLNIIHVAGTKGKGSTCTFCESILRQHGFKTGFYSSPHLLEVRERIRINGLPISKDIFASYFWEVYDILQIYKDSDDSHKLFYFRFLTLLAFRLFLKEKVDVAIIEVGIGGRYDCTNVIRNPIVCGVTSLDYDHMSILGDTLEKIAWHKAGIFKPSCPAISVPQPPECLAVLLKEAEIVNCPLYLTPELSSYDWTHFPLKLGLAGEVQFSNASLALQLAFIWLHHQKCPNMPISSIFKDNGLQKVNQLPFLQPVAITANLAEGLSKCNWPGRFQTLKMMNVTFYLDGAHTPQSIFWCQRWFEEETRIEREELQSSVIKILVFNSTSDRIAESLLGPLMKSSFDVAIFCPNNIKNTVDTSSDQANLMVNQDFQLQNCEKNHNVWLKLTQHKAQGNQNLEENIKIEECMPTMADNSSKPKPFGECQTFLFESITETVEWITEPVKEHPSKSHKQVLVTGSLHLVGGVLSFLNYSLPISDL